MSGSPNYNYPAQPSYGTGMREALEAQVALLTGGKVGDADFSSVGPLEDLVRDYEAPLRETTAQIETDVMRKTILGEGTDARSVRYDDQGKAVKGTKDVGYRIVRRGTGTFTDPNATSGTLTISIVDEKGKVLAVGQDASSFSSTSQRAGHIAEDAAGAYSALLEDIEKNTDKFPILKDAKSTLENNYATQGGAAYVMGMRKGDTWDSGVTNSQDFKNLDENLKSESVYERDQFGDIVTDVSKAGQTIETPASREGTGMIDLIGDRRAVQEQVSDYESYVRNNPDLIADFNANRGQNTRTIEEYGRDHYEQYGRDEGRELGLTLQDTADQAGFRDGQFMGLSALAEDIGRGGQQRAREADIADVERLGGRATEAYRAQGDLSGALAQARAIGAGGIDMESAIPADNLFGVADPLKTLAARTKAENLNIDAITSEGMDATMARSPNALRAATDYQPSADIAGGQIGADALRKALMSDAQTSLAGGLTPREERQISEAMKAQSTMMGRTFDQSAGIAEAKARTLEDRNRQALNRQYAQQVLGQEAGLQQSDLGRGLQASLANQQAANRAAEFGVGSGMQQEQAQAQLDQQTVLANQAARQDAARYSAQEEMQAKQMELGRQTAGAERQLTAEEKDIERIMRQQAMEEQYRQQGLGAERANAAQMVGLEQATSADPFQAILQRQGQNNLGAGGQLFGSAQYGLDSGPQYLNPEAGLGFISNQATNAANMFNAQTAADATRSAGMFGGIGSVLSGGLQGLGSWKCWVAREVYGEHNPAWLLFRNWLDTDAPRWFDKLYLTFGERFANFISNKPRLKARIRLWMDSKIGR